MRKISAILAVISLAAILAYAQTTEFTYQGSLKDGTNLANGNYDFEFALFDSGGAQLGSTLTRNTVAVANGIFSVSLDFGNQFSGAARFLEIRVRASGGGALTTLTPRQAVNSAPYSVKSLNADNAANATNATSAQTAVNATTATTATTANNALSLGGVAPGQYVQTGDARLSDARNPLPASPNYVQNTTSPQSANLNVTGNASAGSLNVNGAVTVTGTTPPAAAPVGQGRIYFDSATNKVRVSENGAAFVNLVGAGGVSGSGTTNSIPLWSGGTALGNSLISQTGSTVQLPSFLQLAAAGGGGHVEFGNPNAETGMTISGTNRADVRFDGSTLKLLAGSGLTSPANGIAVDTAGNVGIGTFAPASKLVVAPGGSGGAISFGTPGGETGMSITGANRGDIRFDGSTLKLLAGPGTGAMAATNGININGLGNVGIGTVSPNTRLTLNGGASWTTSPWTASMNLQNSSALGWEANASGQHFGIGQSGGGLYFFRTNSGFNNTASPPNYDLVINDNGNLTQPVSNNGLVKAMIVGGGLSGPNFISRCYNGVTNSSSGNCGFTITAPLGQFAGVYRINFNFPVSGRFVSITAEYNSTGSATSGRNNVGANYQLFDSTSIEVFTFNSGNSADTIQANFTIIMY